MNSGLSKKAMIRVIAKAYRDLPDLYHSFSNVVEMLTDECAASERRHRNGRPSVRGFSPMDAARYFVVKYLRQYALHPESMPTVGDYLSLRRELFTAAAIVLENQAQLRAWAESVDMAFDSIDYCVLMGGE